MRAEATETDSEGTTFTGKDLAPGSSIGIAIGAGVGVAVDTIGLWLAIGMGLGVGPWSDFLDSKESVSEQSRQCNRVLERFTAPQ